MKDNAAAQSGVLLAARRLGLRAGLLESACSEIRGLLSRVAARLRPAMGNLRTLDQLIKHVRTAVYDQIHAGEFDPSLVYVPGCAPLWAVKWVER